MRKFVGGMLMSLLSPFVLAIQNLVLIFYFETSKPLYLKFVIPNMPDGWDYHDSAVQVVFDFLSPIVGRDARDEAQYVNDVHEWFLSQTWTQKLIRLIISPFIIGLFFFSFYNALQIYLLNGRWQVYAASDYDNEQDNVVGGIAVMEYLGLVALWMTSWFILSLYISLLDTEIVPNVPSLQELRPFVMYFGGNEESIRHNNAIAWIEMRTYLYTKGLIIFSRQEIFISSMMCITIGLLTDNSPLYESETVNGLFFMFLVLCYSLLKLLSTVRKVERLQNKQESLLANQKLAAYYCRITYHPGDDNIAGGGGGSGGLSGGLIFFPTVDFCSLIDFFFC